MGEELLSLSRCPTNYTMCFSGYITNGYRFHTLTREKNLQSQNSGVFVVGNTGDETTNIDYYGVLTDVIMLEYLGGNRVVLFRCNWWDVHDVGRGVKVDKFGVVSLNSERFLKINDPFVLASQASQVFYCNDVANKGWVVALKMEPRDVYDISMPTDDEFQVEDDNNEMISSANLFDDVYQEMESSHRKLNAFDSSLFDVEVE